MAKIIVVLSGGVDSTVLLHQLVRQGNEVRAFAVNYGQRHLRELECALWQCQQLHVRYRAADLSCLASLLPGSTLTSDVPMPVGPSAGENMKLNVVPNRNMILLSVAVGHALALKFDAVAYGAHSGAENIYLDCREEFVVAMQGAIDLCDERQIRLERPFVRYSKAEIVEVGRRMDVDFGHTYSCYAGGEVHCGRCGACTSRQRAFYEAGIADSVQYADPEFWTQAVQKH